MGLFCLKIPGFFGDFPPCNSGVYSKFLESIDFQCGVFFLRLTSLTSSPLAFPNHT